MPARPGARGEVFATGLVEGRSREIVLGFELTGRVLAINVQEGDRVAGGDLVARLIRPSGNSNSLSQRQSGVSESQKERLLNGQREETRQVFAAEVHVAKVQAELAKKTYLRVVSLLKGKVIADGAFDDREIGIPAGRGRVAVGGEQSERSRAPAREAKSASATENRLPGSAAGRREVRPVQDRIEGTV